MSREIVYAIGDIHGRADLLDAVLKFAERDAAAKLATPRFLFIGDVTDKGADSRSAIDLVIDTLAVYPDSVLIKGNHDDWFVRFLDGQDEDPEHIATWLHRGGWQTIQSYACSEVDMAKDLIALLHADHITLFKEAAQSVTVGDYHFVHAGVDPTRPLDDQSARDSMWIRDPFLNHIGRLQKVVVHGHSVVGDLPVVTENRISIDTGAYHSGRLTLMSLDVVSGEIEFHQTDGCAERVVRVEPVAQDRGHGTVVDHEFAMAMAA
jgi:serine/threonine protein phosphatase 1